MSVTSLIKAAQQFFLEVLGLECRVLTVLKDEGQWKAICEVNVDSEYTTRKGLGDIVEVYEVLMNDRLEVLGFKLKQTKRRAALDNE